MANAPHLFEDHHLTNNAGEVNRIGDGLAIKGKRCSSFQLRTIMGSSKQSKSRTASTYLTTTSGSVEGSLWRRCCRWREFGVVVADRSKSDECSESEDDPDDVDEKNDVGTSTVAGAGLRKTMF
jgi:hypothetical protein